MNGMQPTPTQMTPQMADVGLSIAKAVLAIIENPKAIAQADKIRADAAVLTDEQVAKYNEAISKIAWWEEVQTQYKAWDEGAVAREKTISDKQNALGTAYKKFDEDIAALRTQIGEANRKDAELIAREKGLNIRETNARTIARSQGERHLRLQEWEQSLIDRESVLGDTAKALKKPGG